MGKATKKPVTIEFIQWNNLNLDEIKEFTGMDLTPEFHSDAAHQVGKGRPCYSLFIDTKEGKMEAITGDYIIKGVEGEFYPCKPSIFEKTYDIDGAAEIIPIGAVYPSDEETVFAVVTHDDTYGGAHNYRFKNCLGFSEGKTQYHDSYTNIRFIEKKGDTEVIPGLQNEQLVIAMIDRLKKLNAKFPSPENDKQLAGLEMYLEGCKERIDNRMSRGVMGELKK